MAAGHPYAILDVFTATPLEGNPVAVFTDAAGLPEAALQSLARELNLSETVFVYPPANPESADARIRIFTPGVELPFAGHPTLGTAFLIGRRDGLEVVRLETGMGTIPVTLNGEYGEMEQPLPTHAPYPDPDALRDALALPAAGLPIDVYDNGPRFALVDVIDADVLRLMRPDLNALALFGGTGVSCFAVTGPDTANVRMFAPGSGVAEDPATGSAAGPLAVHLARHGRIPFGTRVTLTQGVEIGRPSTLIACARGSVAGLEQVTVGGSAVLVARGEFALG